MGRIIKSFFFFYGRKKNTGYSASIKSPKAKIVGIEPTDYF